MASDEKQRMLELFDNKRADKYPLESTTASASAGVRRTDGYEKATGAAKYTVDVQLPGMLYGRFLTSPYPHAEIVSMDTSEAEKLPGRAGGARATTTRSCPKGRAWAGMS